jgi:hypothetical protein
MDIFAIGEGDDIGNSLPEDFRVELGHGVLIMVACLLSSDEGAVYVLPSRKEVKAIERRSRSSVLLQSRADGDRTSFCTTSTTVLVDFFVVVILVRSGRR